MSQAGQASGNNSGGSGIVVGFASTTSTTPATFPGSTVALASYTPTQGTMSQLLSLNYTPQNAANFLRFDVSLIWSIANFAGPFAIFSLFAASTLLASYTEITGATAGVHTTAYTFYTTAGTTSPTTYSVYGLCASAGGNLQLLSTDGSTSILNGSAAITFAVTELT